MLSSAHKQTKQPRPHWLPISRRFPAARDCLASFLAYETAEIPAGVKPANLINLVDRPHPCGRNFYRLWKQCGDELLGRSGLVGRVLADRGDSLLLFLYRPEAFAALLARQNVAAVLRRAGYPAAADPDATLTELQSRIEGECFPHEIGVFLGYPLKDVAGFMGWVQLPVTGQGPWKIYGDPKASLDLAETFLQCRCRMARVLADCATPLECLRVADTVRGDVFAGHLIENECQNTQKGAICASQ